MRAHRSDHARQKKLDLESVGQPDTSANNAKEMKSRTMKKLIGGGLAAVTATGALLLGAAPAQADDAFLSCGAGAGIASSVTSCEFAHNVRYAWFHQEGSVVLAYSPVTGQLYNMQCGTGFYATFNTGEVIDSIRCVGGNNAVVVVW